MCQARFRLKLWVIALLGNDPTVCRSPYEFDLLKTRAGCGQLNPEPAVGSYLANQIDGAQLIRRLHRTFLIAA